MQGEAARLVDSCISLSYWMRGAITYGEMMNTTFGERERIGAFIERRLESEKKNPSPNY